MFFKRAFRNPFRKPRKADPIALGLGYKPLSSLSDAELILQQRQIMAEIQKRLGVTDNGRLRTTITIRRYPMTREIESYFP